MVYLIAVIILPSPVCCCITCSSSCYLQFIFSFPIKCAPKGQRLCHFKRHEEGVLVLGRPLALFTMEKKCEKPTMKYLQAKLLVLRVLPGQPHLNHRHRKISLCHCPKTDYSFVVIISFGSSSSHSLPIPLLFDK